MKITVAGCGKIGKTIIENLLSEGHEVVCIDNSPEVIEELTNIYDVMCICGNAADCDILTEAGVGESELFISVAGSDENNMLSCFLAKKIGASQTVARIRNPEYNDKSLDFMRRQLEISESINPEYLMAREIYNLLRFPGAVNIEKFSVNNFEMLVLPLKPDSALDGMSLSELRKKFDAKVLVCAVQRGDEAFIPDGKSTLCSGDKIGITATPTEMHKFFKALDIFQKRAKSVIILGASKAAFYLAKLLLSSGRSVKIIEKDREKCEKFSAELPGAVIICGDGARHELLHEEGIDNTDAFVALTGMDEENILVSCYAKTRNVPTVIAKVNGHEQASLAGKLGLECIVSPRKISGDLITGYARALSNTLGSPVETMYKLMDDAVEALEFSVQNDFEYTNIPLKDMNFKENILIAGIIRNRQPIIPAGDDVILPGDKVVVFAAGTKLFELSDIIA